MSVGHYKNKPPALIYWLKETQQIKKKGAYPRKY